MNLSLKYIRIADQLTEGRNIAFRYLLDHGKEFEVTSTTFSHKKGVQKECFRNAALLAMENRELRYVEGYATAVIRSKGEVLTLPLPHAWVIDENNHVIDTTWKDGIDYFGVPIETQLLMRVLVETEMYGIFEGRSMQVYLNLINGGINEV